MGLDFTRTTDSLPSPKFEVPDCREIVATAEAIGNQLEKIGYDTTAEERWKINQARFEEAGLPYPAREQESSRTESTMEHAVEVYNSLSGTIDLIMDGLAEELNTEYPPTNPPETGYAEDPEELLDNLEKGHFYLGVYPVANKVIDHELAVTVEKIPFETKIVNREEVLPLLQNVDEAIMDSPYNLKGYDKVGATESFFRPEPALEGINEGNFRIAAEIDILDPATVCIGFLEGEDKNEFGIGIGVPSRQELEGKEEVVRDLEDALSRNGISLK